MFKKLFVKSFAVSFGIFAGLVSASLFAITISGLSDWASGDTLTADSLNKLKAAVESLPFSDDLSTIVLKNNTDTDQTGYEGSEISWSKGSNTYADWTTDVYKNVFRIFSRNSTFDSSVSIYSSTANVTSLKVQGDISSTNQGRGLILRATDGASCYRLTVNDSGTVATNSVSCP